VLEQRKEERAEKRKEELARLGDGQKEKVARLVSYWL
jgi:hypothetical protein